MDSLSVNFIFFTMFHNFIAQVQQRHLSIINVLFKMNWDYDRFYHYYIGLLGKNKDLNVSVIEFKKVTIKRKQEIEVFFHQPKEVDVVKLDFIECTERYADVYPMGLYIAQLHKERTSKKKRFYIIFPSYKTINQESNEKQIIADHFTFLIENTYSKDKKEVKSHITLYFPTGIVLDKYNTVGAKQRFDFYLPKQFEFSSQNINKYIKITDKRYKECIKELLERPLRDIQNAGGLPLRKTKTTSNERQFVCKKLKYLFNKYYITEIKIIGINEDYTAFITAEVPDTTSDTMDSDDELPEVASFTFKFNKNTYTELEKTLISIMNTWDNKYFHN